MQNVFNVSAILSIHIAVVKVLFLKVFSCTLMNHIFDGPVCRRWCQNVYQLGLGFRM